MAIPPAVSLTAKLGTVIQPDPYARARHVRYFEQGIPYHIVSRTRGNLFLLTPDLEGLLRSTIAGVLAEAKHNWPNISNFGVAVLSNHLHALLAAMSGDPRNIVDYIAFAKREITRRWRKEVGWSGSMWGGYDCAAIITPTAQIDTLGYIVAQGCKENLVEDPRQWPGFGCAESLVTGEPIEGHWFDGTGYGRALHREKAKKNPEEVLRESYIEPRKFAFDKLPALADLSGNVYRDRMLELVEQAVSARTLRFDGPALGPEAVCAMDTLTSRPVPTPPWFEERKRFIVWDNSNRPEVEEYLARYWDHQNQYRAAARPWLAGDVAAKAQFPDICFLPGQRPRPIAHMEWGAA